MSADDRRELIVYATPTGAIAEACRRYFAEAAALGGTTAQTYPPHCTLTGFFHRRPGRVEGVAAEVSGLVASCGQPPAGSVEVVALGRHDRWLGFELSSPLLHRLTADLVDHHQLDPGDDQLRLKDWLHLSLAYGVDELGPYRDLADRLDLAALVGRSEPWEVALWERRGGGAWHRFGPDR